MIAINIQESNGPKIIDPEDLKKNLPSSIKQQE